MSQLEIVGRSSSHFTRTARFFAIELGVPHSFRPVFDLTTLDAGAYADNPALKIPALVSDEGPLFGTENICRELVRRAGPGGPVVLRGDVADRLVANAEELTSQAMLTGVSIILAKMDGDRPLPAKLVESLGNSLGWLDQHVDRALTLLPAERRFSFLEVTLFCLVTHHPFLDVIDVRRHARLAAHCEHFGQREGSRQTPYRFYAPSKNAPMTWVKVPPEHHPLFVAALPKDRRVETRAMFGGIAASVNGHIFAGLFGRSTMIWLEETERAEALALEGAAPFDPMGDGRARSDKIMLPEAMMDDAPELRAWVARAFAGASKLPPKQAKKKAAAKPKAKATKATSRRAR